MTQVISENYSFAKRAIWRFVFLYFLLYIFPYGFEYIYGLNTENISFWKEITIWFGETFIGWKFNRERLLNGFDSEYDYSRFLLIAILSLILTFCWLLIDSKLKKSYTSKIKVLTHTILRYHVGFTLILYGLSKVFLQQFGTINISNLETKIGDLSGMRYLWHFMSYSDFYTISSGLIEVIGGILLFFRRTTLIGTFILFIAMANVVLLDIGYDVRVKMFAIHLFLMTIVLMSDHIKGMFQFFISSKPTVPKKYEPLFNAIISKRIGYIIKTLIMGYFVITTYYEFSERIDRSNDPYPELASMHVINTFVKNGDTLLPNDHLNNHRWKKMLVNGHWRRPEMVSITLENEESISFTFKADTIKKQLFLTPLGDSTQLEYTFDYKKINQNQYEFLGIYKGDTIRLETKAKFLKDYKLTKHGIRWLTVFDQL
ncbi:hypothetical protein [uncultured Aquimarina sp.]|uniref:hypothetical protein n=1 Tax=uncultured Aquimarina sp. TaxID=575652 RepID=UPI0026116031|nr:hypothetical protein [uncultured Aquimarina sp.]